MFLPTCFLCVLSANLSFAEAANHASQAEWAALVEAERAFAKSVATNGIGQGFLEFLADDAILFRPGPVSGRKWVEENPSSDGVLTWEPAYAEIARSGDLGYTTGPWTLQKDRQGSPSAFGEYVTVLRKQADGQWKVLIDLGINHPPPVTGSSVRLSGSVAAGQLAKIRNADRLENQQTELRAADRDLAEAVAQKGSAQAYLRVASDDFRVLRPLTFPLAGKREIFQALSQQAARPTFQFTKAEVSRGGDLGCTYGTARTTPMDSTEPAVSNYLRIWRRHGNRWKLTLDIESPVPSRTKRR